MSNETYHVLGATLRAARYKLGSGVIIVVRKQSQGKTHTVKTIARDNSCTISRIPPGTETSIYQFLSKTNALVYYIDDKDKWSRDEFSTGLRYIKLLTDGEKAPLRATYFTSESVREPEVSTAWSWILLNLKQLDAVYPVLDSTGIDSRAIFLRSKHSLSESKRIRRLYRANRWDNQKLPLLKKYDDWYSDNIRTLSEDELDKIENSFSVEKQSTIEYIGSVMSQKGFESVFDLLSMSCEGKFFEETIEFETRKKIKLT